MSALLNRYVIFLGFLLLTLTGYSQSHPPFKIKEVGTPFINTYLPEEYGAHEQTFAIDQDSAGTLFFANVTGVIRYDGRQWNVDSRVSDDAFRDVIAGPAGKVFGLSKSNYGYFQADKQGIWRFHSLKDKAPDGFDDQASLTNADLIGGQVVFRSSGHLLRYDIATDQMSMLNAQGRFGETDVVDDNYYVMDYSLGLMQLKAGGLELLPGTESLKNTWVKKVLRYTEKELLIITRANGLLLYDFKQLRPWPTAVTPFLKEAYGFSGANIHDQYFAIGTERAGVVIIDKAGKLIQKLDKSTGLPTGNVLDLFLDKDDNLWVAQHGAISQVILNSPFTTIDERHGVDGYVLHLMKHSGNTYVATSRGIVLKNDEAPWQQTEAYKPFRPLAPGMERAWLFVEKDDDFFAAGNMGMWQIEGDQYRSLYKGERLWAAVALAQEDRIVLGSVNGNLFLFEKQNGRWQFKWKIKGFNRAMDFLEQTEDGDIWMTDSGSGVFKIHMNEARDSVLWVKQYGKNEGLPASERNRVFRHREGLVFATVKGVYQYNATTDRFEPNEIVNRQLGEDYVFRYAQMANGTVYTALNPRGKALLTFEGDSAYFQRSPFQKIDGHNSEYVSGLGGSDIWVAGTGIKHYDHEMVQRPSANFKAHLSRVQLSTSDSLLYGGIGRHPAARLSPGQNAVEFSFGANFYDKAEVLEFQSYLQGTETEWSVWTTKASRNYTNLPHGEYTFMVRARNVYGQVSDPATYTFVIGTPIYLTPLAYLLYAVLCIFFVWMVVKLNARRLEREKETLEQIVLQRTEEIRQQKESAEKDKELIEQQANKLRELDKVKSRFFANISHELRTPLTLINAPLESLLEKGTFEEKEVRKVLETARKNGKGLLALVEEILDLAKLDAGKLKLVENPVSVCHCMRDLCGEFDLGFREKGVSFEHNIQVDMDMVALLDENKCGKIMKNLLSNALKFTPAGGEVTVSLSHSKATDMLSMIVTDNGQGIHPNDLPHIFDRYYQSEQPDRKAEGGTGIGLALALELARLQGGDLVATSELGKGSCFELTVPYKEVDLSVVERLTQVDNVSLKEALTETIDRYKHKFEVDKPVMLVTEDHPEMRHFILNTLSPYFHVLEASNGQEALSVLGRQAVDLMVSDVMMPEMDGFELLNAVRKDASLHDLSVIMLTARADEEDKLLALTLGIDDYITKPFSAAEFLARIKNILENRIKIVLELRKLNEAPEQVQNNLQEIQERFELSDRELEVMQLLAKRLTNAEMAEQLHISANTVKYHIKNLYIKLNIHGRAEAARVAESLLG